MVWVYIDLAEEPVLVGRLWARYKNQQESASFEYEREWLRYPSRFSLDPALQLVTSSFHTTADKPLFGALDDSAPDRWGRLLMRRAARKQGEKRTLREIDFLLLVDDVGRQGALRFKTEENGPFLTSYDHHHIPPLIQVGKLLTAATHVLKDSESEEDLRLLLGPGSSLGGARPKAAVRDKDGQLALAKFPKHDDEIDVIGWEAVALTLAEKAGIKVPTWRLETAGRHRVLLSRRFDRQGERRIPFLSAMSALQAKDNETHSYLEIADMIRRMSRVSEQDLKVLFRRIVFNVLVSNVDDHLRNHAFLYQEGGWYLAPAYDLNPMPTDIKPRILSTAIDIDDAKASLDTVFSVAVYFDLELKEAKTIAKEVGFATKRWREVAKKFSIKQKEIERMASAFEHEDSI